MDCTPLTNAALALQFETDNAVPVSEPSYLAILALVAGAASEQGAAAYFTQTENVRCEDGNQRLADQIVKKIEDQVGNILLRHPIKKVTVEDRKAIVTTVKGKISETDYIVLAVPPSAWHRITFEPAIERSKWLPMGKVVKYLTQSHERFWFSQQPTPTARRIGSLVPPCQHPAETPAGSNLKRAQNDAA